MDSLYNRNLCYFFLTFEPLVARFVRFFVVFTRILYIVSDRWKLPPHRTDNDEQQQPKTKREKNEMTKVEANDDPPQTNYNRPKWSILSSSAATDTKTFTHRHMRTKRKIKLEKCAPPKYFAERNKVATNAFILLDISFCRFADDDFFPSFALLLSRLDAFVAFVGTSTSAINGFRNAFETDASNCNQMSTTCPHRDNRSRRRRTKTIFISIESNFYGTKKVATTTN